MINVAILGFGVVGSGTAALLTENADTIKNRIGESVFVKRILDLRDFPDSPFAERITHDINDIINDDDISVVCEVIGGIHPAYEFTVAAFKAGKSVITSNKEIVASKGSELLAIARENGVFYLFEASVGGGIPVLRSLSEDVATVNNVVRIDGILNGTTNYILTKMKEEGQTFAEALSGAQKNGYAEADPSADIEGKDTCRKICILGAIAFNKLLDVNSIHTEGITALTLSDIENAERMGYSVKLIGSAFKDENGKITELVRPCLVPHNDPLSGVSDVFNAVAIEGDFVGKLMLYGRGAGAAPTASAVASDVVRVASGRAAVPSPWEITESGEAGDVCEQYSRFYITADTEDIALFEQYFGHAEKILPAQGKTSFILAYNTNRNGLESKIKKAANEFKVLSVIEVL